MKHVDAKSMSGAEGTGESDVGVDTVSVLDTTLRDGEQSPGFNMTPDQKIQMARALADLNVDVIEAGFAASSPGDFDSMRQIATEIKGPTICSLARASAGDIQASAKALQPAKRSRIHIFLATSPIHREHKLGMTKQQVLDRAYKSVAMAKEMVDEVQFSPEDAGRTELDYLQDVCAAVVEAGADVINIPDTVGYVMPDEMYRTISHLRREVPGIKERTISVHCHNDLGMAVANSLAALQAGARQVDCTINGIGERAGNAAMEEILMALKTRREFFGLDTRVDTTKIFAASNLLGELTQNKVQRNKAIVGENAFAHEAGIHQHGVLNNRETYEIMRPADIGAPDSRLVLGKHSGRHALTDRLRQLGHEPGGMQFDQIFSRFKVLADRREEVGDADLERLVRETAPDNQFGDMYHASDAIKAIY